MDIGIIGLGDMGLLYAKAFFAAGFSVCGCDVPERYDELLEKTAGTSIQLYREGKTVSEQSNLIIYSVEAERIADVVSQYGQYAKPGSIVAGQTSVKHPEIEAFEKFLPASVHIITMHALHGPGFAPEGQKLAVIPHRNTPEAYDKMLRYLEPLKADLVEIKTFQEHDHIVADTQAVTHVGFESMGSAWSAAGFFPWDSGAYTGGIDNVKILTTLRIFSYKAHVYAGLALLNPYAKQQVKRYAVSESELFKLMIQEEEAAFRERIYKARDFVFMKAANLFY